MPTTKAQQKATAKYKKSNYDRMELLLPKGKKEEIQNYAKSKGKSTNAFVVEAIEREMNVGSESVSVSSIHDNVVRSVQLDEPETETESESWVLK
jgi:predicted DNA-binding protein